MKIKSYAFVLPAILILSGCTAEKAPVLSSDRGYSYAARGLSHFREGNYDLALSDFNSAIKIDPKRDRGYWCRSLVYKQQKKYDLALSDINKAININPLPHYYLGRGSVYCLKKEYDSAVKEYIKAIKLKNNYAEAYNGLAWLLATCSDEKYRNGLNAVAFAKKAIETAPESHSFDTLAAAYAEVGDFDMAVKSQEKAIQLLKEEDRSDLDGYEKRLESYKRNTPWREM